MRFALTDMSRQNILHAIADRRIAPSPAFDAATRRITPQCASCLLPPRNAFFTPPARHTRNYPHRQERGAEAHP